MKKKLFGRISALALALVLAVGAAANAEAASSVDGNKINYEHLVTNSNDARLLFSVALGENCNTSSTGYINNEMSNAIYLGGYVYVVADSHLKKVNGLTGEVVATSTEEIPNGYNPYLLYANNKFFVQQNVFNSSTYQTSYKVKAFNKSLEKVWESAEFVSASGGYSPLVYNSGVIYGGLNDSLANYGCKSFFALNASTGATLWDLDDTNAATITSGDFSYNSYGAYWAYGTVIGDYYVVGDDGANLNAIDISNPASVSIATTLDCSSSVETSIRGGVVANGGFVYFASNDGYIHKVSFNSGTGAFGADVKFKISNSASNITATPVIYNNRLYIGGADASGNGVYSVFDVSGNNLTKIYDKTVSGVGKLYDINLVHNGDDVICYASYNGTPGGVISFTDGLGQTDASAVTDYGNLISNDAQQYGLSQVTVADNGVVYFSNDSGYLMALMHHEESYKTFVNKATKDEDGVIVTYCPVCNRIGSFETINRIDSINLSRKSFTYNGKNQSPSVVIKDRAGNVISSNYYSVTGLNAKKVGKYTVTVKFKDRYSGTLTADYNIIPKGTSIKSVSKGSKSFKVAFKKQIVQTSGYQIRYSTSSQMTNATTKTVKGTNTTSYVVNKLKGNKKYYVQVRTFKNVGNKKYYSDWSKTKSVKTKK